MTTKVKITPEIWAEAAKLIQLHGYVRGKYIDEEDGRICAATAVVIAAGLAKHNLTKEGLLRVQTLRGWLDFGERVGPVDNARIEDEFTPYIEGDCLEQWNNLPGQSTTTIAAAFERMSFNPLLKITNDKIYPEPSE